jgi:cytidylate kinase
MTSFEAVVESHVKRWITGERLQKRIRREEEKKAEIDPVPPSITLSCAYGSGAEKIAESLSESLGYQVFDREIMEAVSNSAQARTRIIEALDEGNQKEIASLIDQLFNKRVITDTSYLRALVRVVRFISFLGPAIFIGRGTCHILSDTSSFNVRVTAALEDRVKRIMEQAGLGEGEAKKKVEEQDQMKRGFIKNHFDREIDDPAAYHLVINTSRIPTSLAADFIRSLYEKGT